MQLTKDHEVPSLYQDIFDRHFRAPATRILMAYRRYRGRVRRAGEPRGERRFTRNCALLMRYLRWLQVQIGPDGWLLEMPPETAFQLHEATLRILRASAVYDPRAWLHEDLAGDFSLRFSKRQRRQ